MLNPQAIGTLVEMSEDLIDQDHRQMGHIRKAARLFKQIEEKADDPEAVRTLARLGQGNQVLSEHEEMGDNRAHRTLYETIQSLVRSLRRATA